MKFAFVSGTLSACAFCLPAAVLLAGLALQADTEAGSGPFGGFSALQYTAMGPVAALILGACSALYVSQL